MFFEFSCDITYSFDTSVNPKKQHSGTRNEERINISLPSGIPGGDRDVYLRISGLNEEEKYDTYRCVRFANEEYSFKQPL